MRKSFFTVIVCMLCLLFSFSQNGGYLRGGLFIKTIEYNKLYSNSNYNFNSKGYVEKRLLDKFNAPIEFYYYPDNEAIDELISSFRIFNDSQKKSWVLEFKYLKKDKNSVYSQSVIEETEVIGYSFQVNARFAETFHKKMILLIDKFKAKGIVSLLEGGDEVTFRTVVEDEVWTLKIHEPVGNALKMSDFCKQIMKDAFAKNLNQDDYIKVLNSFNF